MRRGPTTDAERAAVTTAARHLPPAPSHWMARPRLERLLDAADDHVTTLVVAPPGYGKTSLVATWARRHPAPVAWVAFDRSDDADRVLRRIREAVATVAPVGAHPDVAVARPLDDVDELVAAVRGTTHPIVLVLDDVDVLTDDVTHDVLRYLLTRLPTTVHRVVVTRWDPLYLPLASWRWSGSVTEIRAADLAFTDEEATAYLTDLWGLDLAPADAVDVAGHLDGWPAAVHLAAARLAATSDPGAALAAGARAHGGELLDVLLGSVRPPDARFLARTVVLDELTPDLCATITGVEDAGVRLRRLARAGLVAPLPPTGDPTPRYRHRRLVRDLLRAELRHADPQAERELHAAAAVALATAGDAVGAIVHATRAGDDDLALDELEANLLDVVASDGGSTVRSVVGRVDAGPAVAHPRAATAHLALCALAGDAGAVESFTTTLETSVVAPSSLITGARAHLARLRGNDVEALVGADAARSDDPVVLLALGTQRGWEGWHDDAATLLRRALDVVVARDDLPLHLLVLTDLCWERTRAGELNEADLLVGRSLRMCRALGLRQPPLALQLAMTQLALDRGIDDVLDARLATVARLAATTGDGQLALDHALLATVADPPSVARTRLDRLLRLRASADVTDWGTALVRRADRAESALRLAAGDVDGAIAAASFVLGASDARALDPAGRLLFARLLLARGDVVAADHVAADLVASPLPPRLAMQATALQAAIGRRIGNGDLVRSARARHHRAAAEQGFRLRARRPALDGSTVALTATDAPEPVAGTPRVVDLPVELTAREADTLRALASDEPYRVLADQLDLSVNTFKTHVKAIYRKLDVSSREEALAAAARRGLT